MGKEGIVRLFIVSLVAGTVLWASPASAQDVGGDSADVLAIQQVVVDAYVRGVFVDRDPAAVRAGFHPDFVMSVNDGGRILVVSLDEWLDRLGLDGRASSRDIRHVFDRVDVTGDTGVVKLQLWIDGEHAYTDHFALYRLDGAWKVVSKVFQSHGNG